MTIYRTPWSEPQSSEPVEPVVATKKLWCRWFGCKWDKGVALGWSCIEKFTCVRCGCSRHVQYPV
jgi:hypothetical protein